MNWINVNDKLPEDNTKCLIAILHRHIDDPVDVYEIRTAIYADSGRNHRDWEYKHSSFTPTHWMLFPSPPPIEHRNERVGDLINYIEDKFESFGFTIGNYKIKISDIDYIKTNKDGTATAFLKNTFPGNVKIDFSWRKKDGKFGG